ncbi:molecular chaperone DnaJ [Clostridium sp. NSJ-49]|nr:molecular chaperone DnaJ [Clostridium sp. NSJ-49]
MWRDIMNYALIQNLININDYTTAELLLKSNPCNDSIWHYLYSKVLLSKQWFDEALNHLKIANDLSPNNSIYKDDLVNFFGRGKRYSDDYNRSGYRHHNRGCSCCCCDDCCCDCNFSCCDLICLDTCCECMGGDLIDCI